MQDFGESVRPVFFQTDLEEFLYATHGGTMFVVRYHRRLYGLTCKHVLREFQPNQIFIADEKQAKQGSKPAPVKTLCFPSSPRDGAVETDIEDVCVIEFEDGIAPDFFRESEYSLDDRPFGTSEVGNRLILSGVLKEKTNIDPPDITMGYCRLECHDAGATSDPFVRRAQAQFLKS